MSTQRVRADQLRPGDEIITTGRGRIVLLNVVRSATRVQLHSANEYDAPGRVFTVPASTMFVRKQVDRTIHMGPKDQRP